MLNLCVTFDYELFMGENLCPEEEILIRPSDAIGGMLREVGVPATFFADVCCPIRYRQLGQLAFPQQFDEQLVRLHALGNDVQLHIHSNWLEAQEVGERVRFDRDRFRLHNWASGENYEPVTKILLDGKHYLERLLTPHDPAYRCVAFRAGGYCLQPERSIARSLADAGLMIDSSVCCGLSYQGDGMDYDYKHFKAPFNCYFSETVGLEAQSMEKTPNAVLEIPVGGYGRFPQRLIASKLNRPLPQEKVRGKCMPLHERPVNRSLLHRLRSSVHAVNMLTYDFYGARAMTFMVQSLARHTKGEVYIATIAHPKMMHEAQIANMRASLLKLKEDQNIRFVTMAQSAQRLLSDRRSEA